MVLLDLLNLISAFLRILLFVARVVPKSPLRMILLILQRLDEEQSRIYQYLYYPSYFRVIKPRNHLAIVLCQYFFLDGRHQKV